MAIYFTSDQHYYHRNICKFTNRPYDSVEEMNEALIKNHNRMVQPTDTVWMLGDFAFANLEKTEKILKRLNGNKNIILGNHDKNVANNYKYFLKNGLLNSVQAYKEIHINKQSIILFHYGMRVWNKSPYGSWLLYGHSHGSLPPMGKSLDVGVDDKNITDEYRPYSFDEINRFMQKQNIAIVDHHEDRNGTST